MTEIKGPMPRPLVVKKLEDFDVNKDCVVVSGVNFLLVAPGFEPEELGDFDEKATLDLLARGYTLANLEEMAR